MSAQCVRALSKGKRQGLQAGLEGRRQQGKDLVLEPVVSDWEDRGLLPAVTLPCKGVTIPLGS